MKHLALVAALLAAVPTVALADPKQQAKELYGQGKRYFEVADYPHAIDAWKQAYVIASSPILLFNIGQAYRLSGDCANASRFYANYERELPNAPNHDELAQAKALCAAAPPPVVTPEPPAPTPAPAPVSALAAAPVPPPPPTSAELGKVDLDRTPITAPAPAVRSPAPGDPDAGRGLEIAGIATGAAGLAFVVTGLVFGSKASTDATAITTYKGIWDTDEANIQTSGKTDSTVGVVLTGVGIAALIAGPAMFYLGMRDGREAPHVGVAIASGHTELTWSARF